MKKKRSLVIVFILIVMLFASGCGNAEAQRDGKETSLTGVRQELVDFLASYEDCVEEYAEFMQNYVEDDLATVTPYFQMLQKYTDITQRAQVWEKKELNEDELLYYTEAMNRISQKIPQSVPEQ